MCHFQCIITYFSSQCHPQKLSSDCLSLWPNYILALNFNSLKKTYVAKTSKGVCKFLTQFLSRTWTGQWTTDKCIVSIVRYVTVGLVSFFDFDKISWMSQYTCNNLSDTCMSTHRYSIAMTNVPPWSQRLSHNGLHVAGAEIHTLENHIQVCFLFWTAILGRNYNHH